MDQPPAYDQAVQPPYPTLPSQQEGQSEVYQNEAVAAQPTVVYQQAGQTGQPVVYVQQPAQPTVVYQTGSAQQTGQPVVYQNGQIVPQGGQTVVVYQIATGQPVPQPMTLQQPVQPMGTSGVSATAQPNAIYNQRNNKVRTPHWVTLV